MDAFFVPDPGMALLVANRGEIARRVLRTAHRLGISTIAIFADPDADAPHVREASMSVRIGPAALAESYLSIERILEAVRSAGATHVHPGYGFLSERADFAQAVVDSGSTWVGPHPDAIDRMGSKINARGIAADAGVPTIPGVDADHDRDELHAAAERIGYPVLIKASAGGGGKGIRVVHHPSGFDAAVAAASEEAERSFGDPAVIVEKYITAPRHIEVQVAGDRHGTVADLGTRECSVQRRYQKVLEEAPAPNLAPASSTAIRSDARTLASAIDYDSVGTVEFIVDAESGAHYFLEMNTRIQVEHTVTEEITGVDLVELQLALADGAAVPAEVIDAFPAARGCAVEARINAEDSWSGHLPQTGTVETLVVPGASDVRWDAAVELGSEITAHYDSMIGKLIVRGDERSRTLARLDEVLADMEIGGVTTNINAHRWLLRQTPIRLAAVTTRFLDEAPLPEVDPFRGDSPRSPWETTIARRFGPHRSSHAYSSPTRDETGDTNAAVDHGAGDVRAPFPGLITDVHVSVGDPVEPGQVVATIEAMKMLHPITAIGSGVVATVEIAAGSQVAANELLITFDTAGPAMAAPADDPSSPGGSE